MINAVGRDNERRPDFIATLICGLLNVEFAIRNSTVAELINGVFCVAEMSGIRVRFTVAV